MPLGLIALAAGEFGIGLTEFVILGLLPEVAADFNVSIPVARYLVSVCPSLHPAMEHGQGAHRRRGLSCCLRGWL